MGARRVVSSSKKPKSKVVIRKADQPDLISKLFDADVLTGERVARRLVRRLADTTALGDCEGSVTEGVREVDQAR
jgi:hypothetical protein